jgi:hypothetical protein
MKSHLMSALLALYLGAAGCVGAGRTSRTTWNSWEEQSPASLREYQSYLEGLRQFEDQRLWDSPRSRQIALLAQIGRVRQRELPPAHLSEVTSSDGTRYKLLVEAWPACDAIPSTPLVRTTILDLNGPWCMVQEFSPGYRTTVDSVSITNVPELPCDILQLECGSQYVGDSSTFSLWYAILDYEADKRGFADASELVLIRVQAAGGKPGLWVFGSHGAPWEGGPKPAFARTPSFEPPSPAYWERLLRSTNDIQALSALLYIGSDHRKADYDRMEADGEVRWIRGSAVDPKMAKLRESVLASKACKGLAGHRNPLIRELAASLLSDATSGAGDSTVEAAR